MKGFNTLFPMAFHYTGTPIFAMAKRLGERDPEIVKTFTRLYGVSESQLKELTVPENMARYFHKEIRKGMVEIGFSIDWRREFTTIDPIYSRFIEWHFGKLRAKGLITNGTHPVGWCPNDNQPVGMHDTKGDVEPEIGEFFLVKFENQRTFYPTATLRPETAFGVTNVWANPGATYVGAKVDGEQWVVSKETIPKLEHQNHKVVETGKVEFRELAGTKVRNPITGTEVPILPGSFVEPNSGTGLVMSVPGHAPYDYQALVDLKLQAQSSTTLATDMSSLVPVSIIRVEGLPAVPAAAMVEKFRIKDQKDPRLEDATKELYSLEFHKGVMLENTGPYSGLGVDKAREAIVKDFFSKGIGTIYEIMNRPVTCRCGYECLVHIFANQWFINYGDPDWKKLAHESMDRVAILPEEARNEFNYTIDWLKEKACARKVGLGTRLPWDKAWVIEALSDSVVYMAYYVLAKFISQNWTVFGKFEKNPSKLSDSFFDYVFLGEGDAKSVTQATGVPARIVEAVRKEFMYFYPVDMRHSAKDLIPNHLTFYVFQHAVLYPRERWPRGIVANGFVMMEGMKMSKSLENIIPLRQGIEKYGADPVRMGVMATAELGQDTDFSDSVTSSIQERLMGLMSQAKRLGRRKESGAGQFSRLDRWMLVQLDMAVREASGAMEKLRVRQAINRVLYQLDNDQSWYLRRLGPERSRGDGRSRVLRRVLETRARLLAPIAPHTAEEVWSLLGNRGLVAKASWPEADEKLLDSQAEQAESLVRQTLEDTQEILKTAKLVPKRVVFYSPAAWKWKIFLKALNLYSGSEPVRGEFVAVVMADAELRKLGKAAADYAVKLGREVRQSSGDSRKKRLDTGMVDEKMVLREAVDFFARELKAKVEVWGEGDAGVYDPKGRARLAEPYRPGIYVE
jgi:leucyl-tRNA synthetase